MSSILSLANSWIVWVFAILIISVVLFQAIKFIILAIKVSPSVGLSQSDVRSSLKVGAINALGPSLGIMIVVLALITILGNPLTLIRIGIIGSAPIELLGATTGAQAAGTELGSSDFTAKAFTAVMWVLCLGGCGWLLVAALFTKSLGKLEKKARKKDTKGKVLPIVTSAALIGAFSYLLTKQMVGSSIHMLVGIVSGIAMSTAMIIAEKGNKSWLKEWALGIAVISGLTVAYFIA